MDSERLRSNLDFPYELLDDLLSLGDARLLGYEAAVLGGELIERQELRDPVETRLPACRGTRNIA